MSRKKIILNRIPITKPWFDREEERLVVETIRSGWVMQGPRVAQFEKVVADFVGAKYAVATTSCTTALFLALKVFGIGPRDEVIVPSFSFIASANAIVHAGAKPVFADIDPKTYNIDPKDIERKITPCTKAIIAIDQIGLPCNIKEINKLAKKYNLFVLEDAACALGSEIGGKRVGSFADITCFSFHPRKVISTGEGGMLVTNNRIWERLARSLRHHGVIVSKKDEKFSEIGYNFRMTDIQASLGIAQMKKLNKIIAKRIYLAERYNQAFKNSERISIPFIPVGYKHNFQSYILRINGIYKNQRDGIIKKLAQKGIATKKGVQAIHLEPAYIKKIGKITLPNTESAYDQTILIPLFYSLSKKEQDYIINRVLEVI